MVGRGIVLPNLRPRHSRWGWRVSTTPRPLYPPGKTRYPLCRRLGEPQGRSGRVRKISPLPGFDPGAVQPITSRYTDCAIPAISYGNRIFSGNASTEFNWGKCFCICDWCVILGHLVKQIQNINEMRISDLSAG